MPSGVVQCGWLWMDPTGSCPGKTGSLKHICILSIPYEPMIIEQCIDPEEEEPTLGLHLELYN